MIRAAAVLLALLTFPLHAALGPGAEIPVAPPATGVLPGSQATLAVATDGTDFLALWRDETPGRDGIYATVVSESGATRPAVPLPLIRGYADVDVVWTGDHYLVALTRYLEPSFVVSLNRDGEPLWPARRVDLGGNSGVSALAWNGHRVLAIVTGTSGYSAALLDAYGNVVRTGIPLPAGFRHFFTVDAAGDAFIVVWPEELAPQTGAMPPRTRVRAARISGEGAVSAPVELMEPIQTWVNLSSASAGEEVGVAVTTGNSQSSTLRRYTVNASLRVDAEPPLALDPFLISNVNVIATPQGFAASYFTLVANKGQELRTIPFGSTQHRSIELPQSPGYGLWMATNGRTVMAFWGAYPARAAAFDAALTHRTSAIVPVPTAPVRQEAPVIASAGNTGLVAWVEFGTLKARRIDREGRTLDAQPVVLATNVDPFFRPAVAFTGRLWLVAWVDATFDARVMVRRMSPEGVLLGQPVAVGLPMGFLALGSNGNVTALVASSGVNRQGLRLVRFSADGERLDPSPIVLTDVRSADHPAVASNGDGFLVVWSYSPGYTPQVRAMRLDASGNPIEAEPIVIANAPGFSHSGAQVASLGTDYVVAYVQFDEIVIYDPPLPDGPRPAPQRVFTKRVLATGVLADTTAEQDGTLLGRGTSPAIAADGARYVATFAREDSERLWLFAVPLDGHGTPLAVPRLLLRTASYAQQHGIARIGGVVWTTYSRLVEELASVQRVFLRAILEGQTRRRGSRN